MPDQEETLRYDSARARRGRILEWLRTTGFLSVADLCRELGVSDMTVRRDLRKLELSGQARVVRGGVSLPHGSLPASEFDTRIDLLPGAKRSVALAAQHYIASGDTIAVDAGTTACALASTLPESFHGAVVTHSLPVMQLMLQRGNTRVVGLGGDLLPESQAFVGPMSVDAAAGLRVRTFFLGGAAVDARGVYVAADAERPTKLALMDIADQVVLLVGHDKFTTSAPVLLCPLERLTAVVTDRDVPGAIATRLAESAVQVRVGDQSGTTAPA